MIVTDVVIWMYGFMCVQEMKTQRHLNRNLAFAVTGNPSLSEPKHFSFAQTGIFVFSHIYIIDSLLPYSQNNMNKIQKYKAKCKHLIQEGL